MLNRLALLLACFSTSAFAQAPAPAPAPTQTVAPQEDLVPVVLETSLGRITVALDRGRAPVSTANFLKYVDNHRLDGEAFYRAMHMGSGGLIQGGVRTDSRKLYPPIPDEPTSKTGLKNVAGAIVMARNAPDTARADFFILVSDTPGFDAGANPADPNGYSVFGRVAEGMDVVKKILDAPVSPTKGEGVMKGQLLEPVVKIIKAKRAN